MKCNENVMKSYKITKIQASIASSHFLIHIRPFGMIYVAHSKKLRPTVNERGPVSKNKNRALNQIGGELQNRTIEIAFE